MTDIAAPNHTMNVCYFQTLYLFCHMEFKPFARTMNYFCNRIISYPIAHFLTINISDQNFGLRYELEEITLAFLSQATKSMMLVET